MIFFYKNQMSKLLFEYDFFKKNVLIWNIMECEELTIPVFKY